MPRVQREAPADVVFHVINRGVGRMVLFETPADFRAFERCLAETLTLFSTMRLCGYCLMSNHWHLILWPSEEGQLGKFMQRLTITHVRRWVEYRRDTGNGHVYQGRYKSVPVESDGHFLAVMRYVERNALRAHLVSRAEDWPHGSLAVRCRRDSAANEGTDLGADLAAPAIRLSAWPVTRPANWVQRVNLPQNADEEKAIRNSVNRGSPYGAQQWAQHMAERLGLRSTMRPRGRPKKVVHDH